MTSLEAGRLQPSARPAPATETLGDLVAAWVRRTPSAVAVSDDRDRRTYADLAGTSRRVATRLREQRLPPESRVGVLMERCADLPAILLGVLSAGYAAVPLDPSHPTERLSYVLSDAAARVIISDRQPDRALAGTATVLPAAELPAVGVSTDSGVGCEGGGPRPEQLACVLYTSGSTGRPKGVGLTHRGLANNLRATRRLLDYRVGQRLFAVSTISFDIAMLELFLPLVSGGETVVASQPQARDGAAMREALGRWQPDYLQATPMTWRMLLAAGWPGSANLVGMCGGDVVDPRLAARLRACTRGLWHTYGPTEVSLYAVCQPLAPGPQPAPLPIGVPIDGIWARVVDERLRTVPAGAIGELCLGGAGVARGYLGQPGRTAARFVPDPQCPGSRVYRTGDLARMLPDGRFELHGRGDRQVKIRGHRIEPEEIERVLAEHPGVALAAVEVVGVGDDRRMVAYLQPSATADPGQLASLVAGYARSKLPGYLVPAGFGVIDRMPVNANGKVNRAVLSRLRPPATRRTRRLEPDQDRMARLCAELIGATTPASDGFFAPFAAGLSTERAAALVAAVNREFKVTLPPDVLRQVGSPAELLARVRWAAARSRLDPVGPGVRWRRRGGEADELESTAGSGQYPVLVIAGAEPSYRQLVAALEPERAVGFAAGGRMDRYLSDLLALPDPGRLVLIGHRGDAVQAMALAKALQRCAEVRPTVLLIDPPDRVSELSGYHGPVWRIIPARGPCLGSDAEADHGRAGAGGIGSGVAGRVTVVTVPVPRATILTGDGARRLAGLVAAAG